MKKKDRIQLQHLVLDYIENLLNAEKYDHKVQWLYDYGIHYDEWTLSIAIDKDYDNVQLLTLFTSFKSNDKNTHLKHWIYSDKYTFHILLRGTTVEKCFDIVKKKLEL